jgi:hypothetical protein
MSDFLIQNYQKVRARVLEKAIQYNRDPEKIVLLAVSKNFPATQVARVSALGQACFAENYVQEGVQKILTLKSLEPTRKLEWHFIGPLQSNKTKPVAENFDWVQSVDRLKIAQRLSEQRPENLDPLKVLVQVNMDDAPTKAGVEQTHVLTLCREILALPRLVLRGLMTIPDPKHSYAEELQVHTKTKHLFEHVKESLGCAAFDTLSMGMSGDLQAAIEAGSTMLRVGTAIFGART